MKIDSDKIFRFNEKSGIILEDLHDENVLTRSGSPFFIDSAIFLTKSSGKLK